MAAKRATRGTSANRTGKRRRAKGSGWGGARPGAGRKPKGDKAMVAHRRRPRFTGGRKVAVLLRIQPELPSLKQAAIHHGILVPAIEEASSVDPGFRVLEFTTDRHAIRLLAEARNDRVLAVGMKGLSVRLARALNRTWGRSGKVFSDRYEATVFESDATARRALADIRAGRI